MKWTNIERVGPIIGNLLKNIRYIGNLTIDFTLYIIDFFI